MSQQSPGSARTNRTQRLLLGIAAGLGVTVIAGAVFTVTYADLKALAVSGHASHRLAPAYPVMYDVLVTVTILALILAWQRRWWSRWSRWLLLLVLLAGAGAASVDRSVQGYQKLPHTWVKAGVAVAPELIFLIAVWLWFGMFRHARTALTARSGPAPEAQDPALIPGFDKSYEPRHQLPKPAQPQPEPEPVEEATPVARFSLPTDVRLVTRPEQPEPAATTQPDIVIPPALVTAADHPSDLEALDDEAEPEDRPEDPDAEPSHHPGWATETSHFGDQPQWATVPESDDHTDWTVVSTRPLSSEPDPAPAPADDDSSEWSAAAAEDVRRWAAATAQDPAPPEDTPPTEDDGPAPDTAPENEHQEEQEKKEKPTSEWPLPSSTFRSSPTPPDTHE